MEPWYADPDKLGWIGVLTTAVGLFLNGKVMLTAVHDKIVTQMRQDFEEQKKQLRMDYDQRLAEWKDIAKAGVYVAKANADIAKAKVNETA